MASRLILLFSYLLLIGCAASSESLLTPPLNTTHAYVTDDAKQFDVAFTQTSTQEAAQFLAHYQQPWQNPFSAHPVKQILTAEKIVLDKFQKTPGFGENQHPISSDWVPQMRDAMNLDAMIETAIPAITVQATDLRMLPDSHPNFYNFTEAGQGFPFDRLQVSKIPAQTPVAIVHSTKISDFVLVVTPYKTFGWVLRSSLGLVDEPFIRAWEAQPKITLTQDNVPIYDTQSQYRLTGRMGDLYPVLETNSENYSANLAVKDDEGNAVLKKVIIPRTKAAPFPVPATAETISTFSDLLLEEPYGWGGSYGYRDCSSLMQTIFRGLGIWLPRNSYDQAHSRNLIDLSHKTAEEKKRMITQKAIPFRTLIYMPGHIMLYIGEENGMPMVFHNMWGLKTKLPFQKTLGRAIVGQTVVTPINLGEDIRQVPESLLDRVTGMTVLNAVVS